MLEAHIERHLPFCYLTIASEGPTSSATDEERIMTIVPRESWAKARLDAEGRAVLGLERGYFCDPGYYDGYSLTWVWTCLQTFTAAFDLTWLRWLAAQQNHLYLPSLYADPVPPPAIPEVGKTYRFTDQEIREASGLARLGGDDAPRDRSQAGWRVRSLSRCPLERGYS